MGSDEEKRIVLDSIEETCMKLPDSEYIKADISDELYREIIGEFGVYRIDNPIILIIRKGGSTHRVVDAQGIAHCYSAPENGNTVIRWENKKGKVRVNF